MAKSGFEPVNSESPELSKISRTMSYAEKFELLLEMFPFPDRGHLSGTEERKWRNSELALAAGYQLSPSYMSSLRRDKIKDPGLTKLDMIARLMGFPTELWVLEPGEWQERLEHSTRPGLRPENLVDEDFAARLQKALCKTIIDTVSLKEQGNTPYEVARRSAGRLTEEDINAMLEGRMLPNLTQLFAFRDGLYCDLYQWRACALEALEGEGSTTGSTIGSTTGSITTPKSFARQLIHRETCKLDEDELEVALGFIRHLEELRERRANKVIYSAGHNTEQEGPSGEWDSEDPPYPTGAGS